MEIILECLPAVIFIICFIYLCVKGKKGYLFAVSLAYIILNVAYKAVSLILWQPIAASTDVYNLIGALVTVVNYVLLMLVFIHILKNSNKYGSKKAVSGEKDRGPGRAIKNPYDQEDICIRKLR